MKFFFEIGEKQFKIQMFAEKNGGEINISFMKKIPNF